MEIRKKFERLNLIFLYQISYVLFNILLAAEKNAEPKR